MVFILKLLSGNKKPLEKEGLIAYENNLTTEQR
jgi:hypothetical protein